MRPWYLVAVKARGDLAEALPGGALAAINGYANEAMAWERGCSLWTVAKYGAEGAAGVVATGLVAVGGATIAARLAEDGAVDVIFGHGARHLVGTGLRQVDVEAAIEEQVQQAASTGTTGEFWGRVVVNGRTIEYRAYTLPNGAINVGTYYP